MIEWLARSRFAQLKSFTLAQALAHVCAVMAAEIEHFHPDLGATRRTA